MASVVNISRALSNMLEDTSSPAHDKAKELVIRKAEEVAGKDFLVYVDGPDGNAGAVIS